MFQSISPLSWNPLYPSQQNHEMAKTAKTKTFLCFLREYVDVLASACVAAAAEEAGADINCPPTMRSRSLPVLLCSTM